jgi:hypothetical protein
MAQKTTEEKIEDMQVAVKRNRSPLAAAFLEDEAVRLASEKASRQYLLEKEEEETGMKPWMWNLMWFIIGMLFMLTMPPTISNLVFYLSNGG